MYDVSHQKVPHWWNKIYCWSNLHGLIQLAVILLHNQIKREPCGNQVIIYIPVHSTFNKALKMTITIWTKLTSIKIHFSIFMTPIKLQYMYVVLLIHFNCRFFETSVSSNNIPVVTICIDNIGQSYPTGIIICPKLKID